MRIYNRVARALSLEVIARFAEFDVRRLRYFRDGGLCEVGVRVDAGADGGAAERQFRQVAHRIPHALDAQLDLRGVSAEFLSQPDRRVSAGAAFTRNGNRVGAVAGSGRDTLPAWLTPGAPRAKMDVKDLTVFAQKDLPNLGYVSIAGTVARARLVPASEASPDLADRWSSKSVTVGGGIGAFGASVVGHVLDTPGQPAWSGLGVGLTWRTPWSGELTVGADNVVTRGKNPFSVGSDDNEGTVPYVRYEQDL